MTPLIKDYLDEISLVWIETNTDQLELGLPHIFIFEPKAHRNGLAILLKPNDIYISLKQSRWFKRLRMKQWSCACCSDFNEVEAVVNNYLHIKV